MTEQELFRIKAQKAVLEDVAKEYPSRTIENIIANIEARINNHEKQQRNGKN